MSGSLLKIHNYIFFKCGRYNPLFLLTAISAQKIQTEKVMFQNVEYRPTLYRTGSKGIKDILVDIGVNDRQQGTQTAGL